jgi:hypothetical protein
LSKISPAVAAVIVAALFAVTAIVLALAGVFSGDEKTVVVHQSSAPGSSGASAGSGPTGSTASTGQTGPTGNTSSGETITGTGGYSGPTSAFTQFQLPSHNIGCVIDRHYARCDIQHRDWSPPPRPPDCTTETGYGQGLEISGVKSGFVCAGDTTLDTRAHVLDYGRTIRVGSTSCHSAVSGITCKDSNTGRGFFLSIQRYSVY